MLSEMELRWQRENELLRANVGDTLSCGAVVRAIRSNMRDARDEAWRLDGLSIAAYGTRPTRDGRWLVIEHAEPKP